MARKKRYLTATMADGYVKTIGPTAALFTHYWRIVAHLRDGKTEVFWGHATSAKEARARRRGLNRRRSGTGGSASISRSSSSPNTEALYPAAKSIRATVPRLDVNPSRTLGRSAHLEASAMFLFFSRKLGCLGSLALSAGLSLLLLFLLGWL